MLEMHMVAGDKDSNIAWNLVVKAAKVLNPFSTFWASSKYTSCYNHIISRLTQS